jgi:hypothetical protein
MRRSHALRALKDVSRRLDKARAELAVLDEQLEVLAQAEDDARIRALVAETPLADFEHLDAARHAEAARRARHALARTVAELERRRDELLFALVDDGRSARVGESSEQSASRAVDR